MKKTVKAALIAAVALIVAGGLLFGASFVAGARVDQLWKGSGLRLPFITMGVGHDYRNWNNAYSPDGRYAVDASGLSGLDLKWAAGKVNVSVTEGSELVFSETSGQELDEELALRFGIENGVLFIQYCDKTVRGSLVEKNLTVSIPAQLAGSMDSFAFDGASAGLDVSGLTAKTFSFDSASGDLLGHSIVADNVKLSSASGVIDISADYSILDADSSSSLINVSSQGRAGSTSISSASGRISVSGNCGRLSVSTASGPISASETIAQRLNASSSSGVIELEGRFEEARLSTTSGDISLVAYACPSLLDIDSPSGDVSLTLPGGSGFTLWYDTASGDLMCELGVALKQGRYICGDGAARLDVKTASGDLNIYKK